MTPQPTYTRQCRVPDVFGISVDTIAKWERQGLIQARRVQRMTFYRSEDIEAIIEGKEEV